MADERPDFEQIAKSLALIHKKVNAAAKAAAAAAAAAAQRLKCPSPPSEAQAATRRSASDPAQSNKP